jgi:hypothetical protein
MFKVCSVRDSLRFLSTFCRLRGTSFRRGKIPSLNCSIQALLVSLLFERSRLSFCLFRAVSYRTDKIRASVTCQKFYRLFYRDLAILFRKGLAR